MTTFSRFVRYSFTCPFGHTEIREEMIFESGKIEAANQVKRRGFVCAQCKADSSTGKFLVRILVNEPMPRTMKQQ